MTPQTTFVNNVNPWKTHPEHRPRPWAVEPEPETAPVVLVVVEKRAPRNSWRGAVLAQITKLGSASCNDLIDTMNLRKHVICTALAGLRKEGKVRIKTVPIVNRKPSYLYFPL